MSCGRCTIAEAVNMTGNGEDASAVRHHDMLALTHDGKPCLFKSTRNIKMVNARNLGQDYNPTSTSRT